MQPSEKKNFQIIAVTKIYNAYNRKYFWKYCTPWLLLFFSLVEREKPAH